MANTYSVLVFDLKNCKEILAGEMVQFVKALATQA